MNKEFKFYGLLEEYSQSSEFIRDLLCKGVSVQMLINRSVGNSNKGSKRWIGKLISTDAESFDKNIWSLVSQQNHLLSHHDEHGGYSEEFDLRLYASMNYRDLKKAENLFLHTLLDLPEDQKKSFYSRIQDKFVSCLMKPSSRVKKYWLLDIDREPDEINNSIIIDNLVDLLFELKIDFHTPYLTPNGFHIICSPFNLAKHWDDVNIDGKVTLQKDGLVLLRAVKLVNHE